jgi:hypothetical protein
MELTELSYCNAVKSEMRKIRKEHPEYPDSFKSDCKSRWLRQMNQQKAAAELIVNYGWLDRPVKTRRRIQLTLKSTGSENLTEI